MMALKNASSRPSRVASATLPYCHQITLRCRAATFISAGRPAVLQSLDLAAAESTGVEGLGVVPYSWGVPSGRLYSQGVHVCDLPELQHLGISFEAGPIELGRDHYHSALLTTVLSKLKRRHVGWWLFEAAAKKEAAYLFETHPALKSWLLQLAEQKFGKHGYLLVQQDSPSARAAADWLQRLSSSFGKELHNVPVAFTHNTQRSASEILFNWLVELPDAGSAAAASAGDNGPQAQLFADHSLMGDAETTSSPTAGLPEADSKGSEVSTFLQSVARMIPGSPKLLIKQLPSPGSRAFADRVHANSGVMSAAALAAVAAARPGATAAAVTATAAGYVDGEACICITEGLLNKGPTAAAIHVVMAACEGFELNTTQCMAAIDAAAAGATTVANPLQAARESADPARYSAACADSVAGSSWKLDAHQVELCGGATDGAAATAVLPVAAVENERQLVVLAA